MKISVVFNYKNLGPYFSISADRYNNYDNSILLIDLWINSHTLIFVDQIDYSFLKLYK